ncbi:mastermind-like protein 1 isoform X2 [Spea bombifrons]|uniref:mastermind-like protein 1 isoform X2 n=1 Tax=Spea bombifrons TaxID=233779 RepID=UPI00234BF52E|nr:mastermind-like protein 1 isoform X2 [Spea bombifrons]
MADFVVPRHSAVMERLRRRIELCRRHHGSCESRYEAVAGERLDLEKQQTFQLHQRCLQAKAKRAGKHRQQPPANQEPGAGRGSQAGNMDPGDGGGGGTGEQCRNSTLIALHETVKRKLDSAASPQNGDQQNGYGDMFSVPKKLRHDDGLSGVIGSSNGMPPVSPLHQMDSKPPNGDSLQINGNHSIGLDGVNKKCLPDTGLQLNGDVDEFALCLGKEMKQEPVDDLPCMISGVGGVMSQNNLPDLNLNEQEWKELIEELNKSVPDEDMKDIFGDDFGEKKDTDASNSATQTPLPQDIHIKSEFSPATFEQESIGSPQVRSASSGPYVGNASVPAGSASPVVGGGAQTVFQPSTQTVTDSSNQTMMQTSNQAPNVQRPLPNVLMQGQSTGTAKELSSAHQLQQIAAKQKRDQMLQNQSQVHQANQMTNWPQSRSSQSPLGVPYNMEKPTSPSVYQQDFNNQKMMMQNMNKSSPRGGGNYMQPNHVNMIGHKPPNNMNPGQVSGPNPMLDYGNTKPLSHYEADCGPGVAAQNQSKAAMLTYLQQRQPQQMPHMTDEQSQMFLMKRKAGIPYRPLVPHGQDQNPQPNVQRVAVSAPGPGVSTQPPQVSMAGNHSNGNYLSSQQQAVMKQQQQLMMEQKQREQLLMEQQKQQQQYHLMGQRQQLLAEQEKQRHQQEQQLQRHLTRPPPQYQDQPPNSYPQQQVGPFPGSNSVMNHPTSGSPRMFSQTQSMIQMGTGHASVTSLPSGSNPQDRAVSQYPNLQSVQRGGMYNMGSGLPQMVPNHATQPNIANGQPQIQRPTNMGQGNPLPAGYGQNVMGNAGLPPQHNKGMNPALAKAQMPRMPTTMAAQNPTWQHQGMQNMNSQAQGNNGLGGFNPASAGFHIQQNHHKMANQQFGQGMPQVGLGSSRPMSSINSSVPGQMMPNMASQQRTNPASQQPASKQQVLPVMNQAVPDLNAFNQNPGQQMANRAGLHCNQNYQVRSANQDLPFVYGNQSGNGALQNLSGDADLLDSLLKNRTSEEWMNDLDELLGNH